MAILPLITTQRATQNAALAALNSSNPAYLSSLINAGSAAVCKYCGRDFVQQSYSEFYNIDVLQKGVPILIRQFPVQSISRVAIANQAFQVQNSNNTVFQRATVSISATSLTLYSIASAVPTTTVLPYTSHPTLAQLANAIQAVGNGWSATILSGPNGSYQLWPSADLKPLQGAVSAFLGGAWLELYDDVAVAAGPFATTGQWGSGDGWDWSNSGPGWRLQPETGEMYIKVRRGSLILRIDYTAGFATVPEDVQEATVQLVQWVYQNSNLNLALESAKLGDSSFKIGQFNRWPTTVLSMLSQYRAYDRMANY